MALADSAEANSAELWDDCPLFAPNADHVPRLAEGAIGEELPESVVALSHLLYDEDSAEEKIDSLREEGNTMFKHGHVLSYKRAIQKYTEALAMPCDLPSVRSSTFANRAAAELKLKNYGRALNDAESALKLDEDHVKSRYRAAMCANFLSKFDVSLKHCDAGVASLARQHRERSPDAALFELVRKQALSGLKECAAKENQRREKAEKLAKKDSRISRALDKRNVTKGMPLFAQQRSYARTEPELHESGEGELLLWPVLVVYPDVVRTGVGEQSDYLEAVSEDATIDDLICTLFPPDAAPPPWDVSGVFSRRPDKLVARYRMGWTMKAEDASSDDERDFCGSNLGPDDVGEWKDIPRSLSVAELVGKRDYVTPLFPVLYLLPA